MKRKYVYLILLLFPCFVSFSQTKSKVKKSQDSTSLRLKSIEANLKELSISSNELKSQMKLISSDSTKVTFGELNELKKILFKEEFWFIKYLPSLIALAVVIISSYVSFRIAKKQIEKDVRLAAEQLRTQESLASEQLKLGREQLDRTINSSLEQIKANNLLQARISWIQDLRNSISDYYGCVIPLAFKVIPISNLIEQDRKEEVKPEYDKLLDEIGAARKYSAKTKLFLTSGNEDHQQLLKVIAELDEIVLKNIPTSENWTRIKELIDELEIEAGNVLKQSWEEAKNNIL